jgi:Photosynthesis system II assembly factor YCF48/Putative zinc-finger
MEKIPQIVRERLKAGAAISGHPDANALTAFAESSLPERERAGVLAHLAACGDCREIVALALPAIETGNTRSSALRVPWFAWPAFRWGFATAGVALLSIGVVEFEQRKPAPPGMLAKQVASTPVPNPLQVQTSSQATSSVPPATAEAISGKSLGESIVSAKKEARRAAEEPRLRGKPMSPQPQTALAFQAGSPALVAKQAPSPIPPASQMITVPVQNEATEVPGGDSQAARVQIPSNAEPVFDSNLGYNSAPLTRAKPANITPIASGTAGAVLATSRWSVTAVGGLERSLDQGKTWRDVNVDVNTALAATGASTVGPMINGTVKQNSMSTQPVLKAVTPVFFRAVTAAGSEVWAGGSHAALFHSVDGGDHWTRILPSSSGVVLTGDVVSIEFPDLLHGTVTTSTPEIWMTVDDGQSWQKQ